MSVKLQMKDTRAHLGKRDENVITGDNLKKRERDKETVISLVILFPIFETSALNEFLWLLCW